MAGPYYADGLVALTPLTSNSDGTPNIVLWASFIFPTDGYVTGFRFWHDSSPSGTYRFSIWEVTNMTSDDNYDATFLDFVDISSPYTGLTAGAYNDVSLTTPVAVDNTKLYALSVYSDTGHYQFYSSTTFNTSWGTYPTDFVYAPAQGENLSLAGISSFPGYTAHRPAGFDIGAANDITQTPTLNQSYYGVTPIYYTSIPNNVSGTGQMDLGSLVGTATGEGESVNPKTIRSELADQLATISGLRTSAWPTPTPTPPHAIIFPQDVTFDLTYQRGLDEMEIAVLLFIGKPSDRSSYDRLDDYTAGSGSRSIKQVLEAGNGSYESFEIVTVERVEFGTATAAGVEYLAATFILSIRGPGEV